MKKILLLTLLICCSNFYFSQNILSSFPKTIKDRTETTITVKCYNVDFKQNKYEFYFSNNYSLGFIVIKNIEFVCNDIAKITIHSNNYFTTSYDLTIKDLNSGYSNTLKNALQTYSNGNPVLTSISKNKAKKGEKLTVKFSGLNTNFKSGQASKTTVSFNHFNQGSSTSYSASSTIYATSYKINSETDLDANFTIPTNAFSGFYYPTVENYLDGELSIYEMNKVLYVESENQAKIISVNKLYSASTTLLFEITVNPEHNLYLDQNREVNFMINDHFISASSTILSSNKMKCELDLDNQGPIYNGSYSLYYTYNYGEFASFENALIINNNPRPTLTNLPIKLYPGINKNVILNGINMKFNEFATSIYVNFDQGSSTNINIPKSNNSSNITFDFYVPKGTKSGKYSFYINRIIEGNGVSFGEYIDFYENAIEVVNNIMPTVKIDEQNYFNSNKEILFNIQSTGLNLESDLQKAYVYFSNNEEPTPITISNKSLNKATLSCYVSPFAKTGSYKVIFETLKDGLFESENFLNIKGSNPDITKIEPNIGYTGVTSEFTLTIENMNVNAQTISGLYFEFEDECTPTFKILNTTNETVKLSLAVPSNVAPGKYKVFIKNPTTEIISNAILEIKDIKSVSIESIKNNEITIYPNPVTNGKINIMFGGEPFNGEYKLIDTQGKIINSNEFKNNMIPGLYFIELTIDNRTYTRKIIVD